MLMEKKKGLLLILKQKEYILNEWIKWLFQRLLITYTKKSLDQALSDRRLFIIIQKHSNP
jgi:hypothetical protein